MSRLGNDATGSAADEADTAFNNNIKHIKKITLKRDGCLCDSYTCTATIGSEIEITIESGYTYAGQRLDFAVESAPFLDALRDLHIGQWKEVYCNCLVVDGYSWSLIVEYNDDELKTFTRCGFNDVPSNFGKLERLMISGEIILYDL